MQLKLTRSQRTGGLMGKTIFVLDARADLTPDEKGLVKKYALGKLVVYDSDARKKHQEAAYANFGDGGSIQESTSTARTMRIFSSAEYWRRVALRISLTVFSALSGLPVLPLIVASVGVTMSPNLSLTQSAQSVR